MIVKIVTLCGEGSCCPTVEIDEEEIRIGEEGNLCRLTPEQWNALVDKISSGELGKI